MIERLNDLLRSFFIPCIKFPLSIAGIFIGWKARMNRAPNKRSAPFSFFRDTFSHCESAPSNRSSSRQYLLRGHAEMCCKTLSQIRPH